MIVVAYIGQYKADWLRVLEHRLKTTKMLIDSKLQMAMHQNYTISFTINSLYFTERVVHVHFGVY